MSAFRAVLRHELKRAKRDRALPWLILLFAAATGYAAWNGARWAEQRGAALQAIAQQEAKFRAEVQERTAEGERRRGISISPGNLSLMSWNHPTLPVHPLAPLSIGQADGYPYDAKFHGLTDATRIFQALGVDTANPTASSAGFFDLAFVIVFLLPLFLLAATYDVWAQERDLGTAPFLISQPVQPATLLVAKTLARGGSMLAVMTIVFLIALFSVTVARGGEAASTSLAGLVVLLYGSFWVLIAAAVNVFPQRSTAAAMACGALWLILALYLPALSSAATDLVRPAPSQAQHISALRTIEVGAQNRLDQTRAAARAQLQTAGVNPRDIGMRVELMRLAMEEREYESVVQPYQARDDARRQLASAMRILSPAVAAQDALDRVAGTDATRALAFQAQVRQFLRDLRSFATREHPDAAPLPLEERFRRLPAFRFHEASGIARFGPLAVDVAVLLVFSALPLLVLWRALRRNALALD